MKLFIDERCAQATDRCILKTLQRPPKKLSDLIDLKLARVNEAHAADLAFKVLQMVGVAKRPLLSPELRELISVEIGQDSLDVTRLPHSMEDVINLCGGLVFIDEEDFSVQFVHHSVRQSLFSHRGVYHSRFSELEQDEHLGCLALTYLNFKELSTQLTKKK